MALTQKQYEQIKGELDDCRNPIYFFDDDCDGLCSFLLLYRYKKEGHGIVVKTHPKLDMQLIPKIDEYQSDKAFVLDVAHLEQEFIDSCKVPVVWVDHHGPFERRNIRYFNPRISKNDDNIPTTFMCYKAVMQDMWIAMVGSIADYYIPDFIDEFRKEYPDLIGSKKTVTDIYFGTKLGTLIKIFSFSLKGKSNEAMRNIKILTRIGSPYEILNQETAQGRFIFRRYENIKKLYDGLLEEALAEKSKDNFLVFTYTDEKMSFTGDLANELLYRFPDKLIIVGRKKEDDIRMSIRSSKVKIPPMLEKALVGLQGYGGGHEYACGANVKERDFKEFVERLKKQVH